MFTKLIDALKATRRTIVFTEAPTPVFSKRLTASSRTI